MTSAIVEPPQADEASKGGRMDRLLAWLDDRVNPIVLKELRQNAQSNVLASIIVLVMLVSLGIVGLGAASSTEGPGLWTFIALNTFMMIVCAVVIPLGGALRMLGEVNDTHGDLLSISTITPIRFVMGKIGATLLVTAMVFGMSLPFLTVCYYLNGISIPLILIAFWLDVMVIFGGVVFSICIVGKDPNPVTRYLAVLAQPAMLIPVFVMMGVLVSAGSRMVPNMTEFMLVMAHLFMVEIVLCVLFITAAVVRMMPETANRSVLARLAVTAVTIGSAAYLFLMDKLVYKRALGGTSSLDGETLLKAWSMCAWGLMILCLLVVISGRDRYGSRIRNLIPAKPMKRLGAFVLFSGAGGGVVWWLMLCGVLLGIGMGWSLTHGDFPYFKTLEFSRSENTWLIPMRIGVYAFLYAMSAVLLRHYLMRNWAKPMVASVLAVAGMVASVLLPLMLSLFLMGRGPTGTLRDVVDMVWALSPLGMVIDDTPRLAVMTVVALWSAVVVVGMIPWLRFHWTSFTRLEPDVATQEALMKVRSLK